MTVRLPRRTCRECHSIGRRLGEMCRQCKEGSPTALTHGRWVIHPRRRVLVWERA